MIIIKGSFWDEPPFEWKIQEYCVFLWEKVYIYYFVLKANAEIQLDEMLVKGDYILSSLFTKASGPFTVILKNVVVKGNATIGVERDGKVRTQEIAMDMSFSDMSMDFQNLGKLL